MKKLLVILFLIPLFVSAQNVDVKELLKFSTFYGAVNGGTSLSDVEDFSITNGLQTQTIETPFDYSVLFGIRKIKRLGYEPKERFKNGTENSFSDAATIGRWENKLEFLFQGELKRQQGENYFDQHHFLRFVNERYILKGEYLEDGFADIEYFETSERYRHKVNNKLSFNIGAAQRLSEPYGYDPLAEWLLSTGNLHYTQLAIEEGYEVEFDGQGGVEYFDPSGTSVATSTEVWEAVIIPIVLADYVEKERNKLDGVIQHSVVLGFDYYHYSKTFWVHSWGNVMPYHYDAGGEFSYHNYNDGKQWLDYSGGLIFGYWFNKNLGIFIEGKYNKYWNREWHDFSAGINYRVF